jgi:anaerobic magnesium-protoporphyrin IX monomethyl ester cyclase
MKPTDVFLVATPFGSLRAEPLGLAYCAAAVRKAGFRAGILAEAPGETFTASGMADRCLRSGAPVIGFSITSPALPLARAVIERIKKEKPEATIIAGGYHPTLAHQALLADCPGIDIVVRAEGEETLPELLYGLFRRGDLSRIPGITYRRNGRIVVTPDRDPIRDLDALPFPARDLLPEPRKYRPFFNAVERRFETRTSISSSRGCPYNCAFCSIISFYRDAAHSTWRARSPENIFREAETLVRRHGVRYINFCDDNFLVSRSRAMEVSALFRDSGLGIHFGFNTRADQILKLGEDGLKALKEAGLREVEMGVESGSQSVLDRFAKGTRVETNRLALEMLERNGIRSEVDFIMFDPWTTLEDLKENVQFIERCVPANYYFRKMVHSELILNPGSPLREQFLELSGIRDASPHEIIPYRISDLRAAGVYDGIEAFRKRVRPILDRVELGLDEIQMKLFAEGSHTETLKKFLAEAVFILIPLTRMPLKCFKKLVVLWEKGGVGRPEVEALLREFEASAGNLEKEFETLTKKHGLGA